MDTTGMDAMDSAASWDVPDNSVDASIAYLIAQGPKKEPSPYGDVVLQVGSGKGPVKSIRVSSQVLSIASPVFARMFGSGFLEGSVSSSRSDQPLHLPLPEDDPDAVLLMCHVLHPSGVGDLDVPLQLLESLALLVDKYDCALALTVWSRLWFQQRYNYFNYTSRPWDRLRIAYALGTEEAFWEISKNIIHNYGFEDDEESQESRLYQTGALELPGLKEFMTNERDLTLDRLYSTIEEILSSSMEYSDICHQVEPGVAIWGEGPQRFAVSDTRGCRRPTEIAHFLQQLHGNNVWPRKSDLWQGKNIEGILDALRNFKSYRAYYRRSGMPRQRFNPNCRCIRIELGETLGSFVGHVSWDASGLCLNCFELGALYRNCRAKKREYCKRFGQELLEEGPETKEESIVGRWDCWRKQSIDGDALDQ